MLNLIHGISALVAGAVAVAPPITLDHTLGLDHAMADAEIIALQNERYERLTIPVRIDGAGPFRFMVDTGAQSTVISDELAQQLQLFDRQIATLVGMASRRQIETVALDGIELGTRFFNVARAPIVPQANIGSADGIIGLDSLQDQRVLIDFDKKQLSVADGRDLGGNSGYEIIVKARRQLGQLIITEASMGGIRVAVLVDTGAQGSIGNTALLKRLRSKEHSTSELTDINGVQLSGSIRVARSLQVGRARIENLPIFFADTPTFHALGLGDKPALVLGIDQLKLFRRVAIDFKSKRILFDVPNSNMRALRTSE
jgi:predicted aspartyl protease